MHNTIYFLACQLGELLKKHDKVLTLAESCTGGGCAQAITAVPGSSAWFGFGFVTYSNHAKMTLLRVNPSILKAHGAVSEEVVRAMITGSLESSGADFSLAISGIAGPSGDSTLKPLGTICIAVGSVDYTRSKTYRFIGGRGSLRAQSVTQGLKNLLEFCSEKLD